MADNTEITSYVEAHTPLDKGKKDIKNIFEEQKNSLLALTFISEFNMKNDSIKYLLPKENKFLYQKWNKTFLVKYTKTKIKISLIANFIIESVKECTYVYNDKSGKRPLKYYVVTLRNANGKTEKDIEIANNAKSDYKQFQSNLNQFYNGFTVNMSESEFKAFVEKYISPKASITLTIYKNAGVIADNMFLYENSLVREDKTLFADEDGYIKIDEKSYIKVADGPHLLPILSTSSKTGQQVANELITNLLECWSNIVFPLLTLGHMIMSIYFEDFVKKIGVPTLLLYGETGTGKSTLIAIGLAIFGLSKDAMTSGGSTAKSNEYFASNYNGMNIAIDDVKGDTLTSQNFISLIKSFYNALARTRMLKYGKGVEYIFSCSPLAYSTNEALPDLKEVVNRMNIIRIFGNVFNPEKFKYHEPDKANSESINELSLILPELIKMPKDEVMQIYKQVFEIIEQAIPNTQKRIINNIAYAYTGALLLLAIANVNIPDFESKVIDFAINQKKQYESIKTPVDKVLNEIVVLTQLGQLSLGTHFKIFDVTYEDRVETHIRFHKETVLSVINKYYSHDRTKQINESTFLDYAKNHERYRGNNHPTRLKDENSDVKAAICFNISGLDEFVSISPHGVIRPISTAELKANIEANNS